MESDWKERYARRTQRMTSSAIRELLELSERPGFISFAGGRPAPELFPGDEVANVAQRILRGSAPVALQYGATEGYRPLRELIAGRMSSEGIPTTVDNVLITTGSQQGLDLLGKIFLDAGDVVVVESPTYLAALQAWKAYEAEFISVPTDEDGMDTAYLDAALVDDPKMIYCVPNFGNPRGITLSLQRRDELVEIAARHGIPVVEDDPYRDIRFEGKHLPRLISLDAARRSDEEYAGNIIALGTFSKILAPGLRVGWVVAAPQVIAQLTLAKQGTDLHTSTLDQMIAHEMLGSGYLEGHRQVIVDAYRERRDVMLEAVRHELPSDARWTVPAGGMFLWGELNPSIDTAALLRESMNRKVAFVPGAVFHADGTGHNTLRLNFSNSTPETIREGVSRLAQAFQAMDLNPSQDGAVGARLAVASARPG